MKENLKLCCHCVIKLHEETEMFVIVDNVRAVTVTKSCK